MSDAPQAPASCPPFRLIGWLAATLAAGFAIGLLAAIVQQRFAPLVLFPLMCGAACGAAGAGLARAAKLGHRIALITGTSLAVAAMMAGLHWYSFRLAEARSIEDARHHMQLQQLHPEFAKATLPPPPPNVWEFLSARAEGGRPLPGGITLTGPWVWAMWGFEGLLSLAAALGVLIPAIRQPYCDRCRSWFRTVRRGGLPRTAHERAAAWTTLPAENLPLEYRLLACESGCGPTGLELSWPVTPGERGVIPAGGIRIWLSEEQRHELLALLDAEHRQTDGLERGVRPEPPNKT